MREIPSEMQFHGLLCPRGRRKQRSKRALDYGGWTSSIAVLFTDFLYSREAEFSVSSSLHRDRVMEARFDVWIIRLPNRARAIDGVMFRREAWVVRSMLNSNACCRLMPYGQGGHIIRKPVGFPTLHEKTGAFLRISGETRRCFVAGIRYSRGYRTCRRGRGGSFHCRRRRGSPGRRSCRSCRHSCGTAPR